MARTEVRKECPSCGLGVPLDAKVCEFCGWNFDEEDEWITQIDKLEQELITEKQKFDDTSVDKMIKSTLRKPEEKGDDASAETAPPAEPVKMKKIAQKPPQAKTAIKPPEATQPPVANGEAKKEPAPAASGPVISKPKSFKIDVAKASAPKESSMELEIEESKGVSQPKEQNAVATGKPVAAEAPAQKKPEAAAPTAPPKQDKVVRRVVKSDGHPKPMMATGEARKATPAKPAAPAPVQQKPAPEKPKPPVAAEKTAAAPAKEEKKSRFGFGKMFSHEKEHSAPEKVLQAQHKEAVRPTVKVFICPLCNKEVLETERKCPNCGAEFE